MSEPASRETLLALASLIEAPGGLRTINGAGRVLIAQTLRDAAGPEPVVEPEPAYPLDCNNCGALYDDCNKSLRKEGRCCCKTCHLTATHNQNEWESWDQKRKETKR